MTQQTNFERVKEFTRTFKQTYNEKPTEPSAKDAKLRLSLIAEEFDELLQAALNPHDSEGQYALRVSQALLAAIGQLDSNSFELDHIEAADALADLLYVTYGTGVTYGHDLDACMKEVHDSNMSKLVNGEPIFNSAGKVMKGGNYFKPNLAPCLGLEVK